MNTETGGCRGSRRFTHFDPLANSPLRLSLPVLRASGKSLALPGFAETGLSATIPASPLAGLSGHTA
jgi:hypothetical protein